MSSTFWIAAWISITVAAFIGVWILERYEEWVYFNSPFPDDVTPVAVVVAVGLLGFGVAMATALLLGGLPT